MSSSRMRSTRCRTSVSSSSPSNDDKISVIKNRINQIADTMRGSFQGKYSSALSETLPKEVKNWENDENLSIEAVFKKHGLEEFVFIMKENFIALQDLKLLNKDDLICMKIPIGPRNRILRIIENLENGDRVINETQNFHKKKQVKEDFGSKKKNNTQVVKDILVVISRISDKQAEMFEMIKENQREIDDINQFPKRARKY